MKLLFAFILFSIVSSITPGPNNIMIMSSGLNFGIKRSLPHFFGICLGFPLMVLMVGLGIGTLFMRFPVIHQIIKILGAIYMLYLAWQIARSHLKINSLDSQKPLSFLQALLFQWVNPKAWVMGVGAVAAYTTPNKHFFLQTILISLIFMISCFFAVAIWMCFGSIVKSILRSDLHRRYFNYIMSFILVISITLIFIE